MINNFANIQSPSYILDERLLQKNLELMKYVQDKAGISIILAFKGFATWKSFPLIKEYLKGATASSLNEARLCNDEMKCKAHTYAPAYLPNEIDEVISLSSHICFNSLSQFHKYKHKAIDSDVSIGLRVNPEWSDIETDLYNPCTPGSRLGILSEELKVLPHEVDGLHVHALCESNSYSFEKLIYAVEENFKHLLPNVKWINFGGGHLMTKEGYDIEHLITILKEFKNKHDIEIILEPGSAVAWNTGVLLATVLDIVERKGIKTAILDISFSAHLPDTIEMPYRPVIRNAFDPTKNKPSYRLGGLSCLSGDYLDEYSFEKELEVGQKLIFEDMIHYTIVKTTMFNGVTHPSITIIDIDGRVNTVKNFSYEDYKNRLS